MRSYMQLRGGKVVQSIFTALNAEQSDDSSSDETDDDSDENVIAVNNQSSLDSVDGGSTNDMICRAIDQLNEMKATVENQKDGKKAGEKGSPTKPNDKATSKDVTKSDRTEESRDTNNNITVDTKPSSLFLSDFSIGRSIHRSCKQVAYALIRSTVFVIMRLTSLTLALKKYKKRIGRKQRNDVRPVTGMMTRRRSLEARSRQDAVASKPSTLSYVISFINIMAILFLIWKYVSYRYDMLPNPRRVGMDNCNEISFPPSSRIQAWHILPAHTANLSISEVLYQGLPIVLYVRNKGAHRGAQHTVNVLRTLSSKNYHVLASVAPLSDVQTVQVWSHLNKISNNSMVYTWFERGDVNTVKAIASTMCNIGYPPSGIIMETKKKEHISFQSIEIWSSSCKTRNETKKFNFLKCPISTQLDEVGMWSDMTSCFRAVDTTTYLA